MALEQSILERFRAAGAAVEPMRGLDDVAQLFLAAGAYAQDTFDRAERVLVHFEDTAFANAEQQLRGLLERMSSMSHVDELVRALPATDGMSLITERTTCAVCDNALVPTPERSYRPDGPRRPGHDVPLFSARGVKRAQLYFKTCTRCHATHGISYAWGGDVLAEHEQQPYPTCTDARYFHCTESCVWEASLLIDLETQMLLSHTGIETFTSEYVFKHGKARLPFSADRARHALTHAFFAWTLVRWRAEMELPNARVSMRDAKARGEAEMSVLDQTLMRERQALHDAFKMWWGGKQQHEAACRNPGQCVCHAVDGHVKARRKVCSNRWARFVNAGPLGVLTVNCSHMPVPGSKFCRGCRDACARSGREGLVGVSGESALRGIPSGLSCEPCDSEALAVAPSSDASTSAADAAAAAVAASDDDEEGLSVAQKHRIAREAARGWDVSAAEKDVYLVEKILSHKAATIEGACRPSCSLGGGHRSRAAPHCTWGECRRNGPRLHVGRLNKG